MVELKHYVELEDIIHVAMKVKRQLNRNGTNRYPLGSSGSNPSWKLKYDNSKGDRDVSKSRTEVSKERE